MPSPVGRGIVDGRRVDGVAPRSSTGTAPSASGRAVNRTAEERCAPCGNDHSVWRALRHGDAGQIRHCKRDLKRPLYGARRAGSAMEGVFRVASPCELLMHFGHQRLVARLHHIQSPASSDGPELEGLLRIAEAWATTA